MSYTLRQTADLTGFSTKTLRRKIASGELRATKQQGKYGEEYIIKEIPETLLAKSTSPTGQSGDKAKEGKTANEQAASSSDEQEGIRKNAETPARDEALFAELFSASNGGQSSEQENEKDRSQVSGDKGQKRDETAASNEPFSSIGQGGGQSASRPLDNDTALHELLKLVRKLQEENAALHEKIGELNATVQLLSSGRMLPMAVPNYPQAVKSWWNRLAFWRK